MTDFKDLTSVMAPATKTFEIDPSVLEELPQATRAIYVGTSGDIVVRFAGDSEDRTLANVVAGIPLPFRVTHVRETGTTAADIVGMA